MTQVAAKPAASRNTQRTARLGGTARGVLFTPRAGFTTALKAADRRARQGAIPAEGVLPPLLAAVGGAALVLLWLKVGGLLGIRDAPEAAFRWSYVATAVIAGAAMGVVAQLTWGWVGSATLRRDARAHSLRLVWGASAGPQILALAVLLPLDLLIVGPETFTTERIGDTLATTWAAISVALALSLAVWSLLIFARGVEVATGASVWRGIAGVAIATANLAAVVAATAAGALAIEKAIGS